MPPSGDTKKICPMKVVRIALKFPAMCLTTPESDQEGEKTRVLKWLIYGVLGVISWRVPSARQLISRRGGCAPPLHPPAEGCAVLLNPFSDGCQSVLRARKF